MENRENPYTKNKIQIWGIFPIKTRIYGEKNRMYVMLTIDKITQQVDIFLHSTTPKRNYKMTCDQNSFNPTTLAGYNYLRPFQRTWEKTYMPSAVEFFAHHNIIWHRFYHPHPGQYPLDERDLFAIGAENFQPCELVRINVDVTTWNYEDYDFKEITTPPEDEEEEPRITLKVDGHNIEYVVEGSEGCGVQ